MRLALLLAALVAISGAPRLAAQAAEPEAKPPNVVFITIDTLRSSHLSTYGYHLKTSPNIDKLAAEGVRYDNAYTVVPRTGPSHVSMFTSRYPQEHGVKLNGYAVPDDAKWLFLPQVLRRFGYHTAAYVSSWPLTARLTHLDRWFDKWDQELDENYQMINSMRSADKVGPEAVEWLKANHDRKEPFFLWVHYFDPHSPYEFREEFSPEKIKEPDPIYKTYDSGAMKNVKGYDSEIYFTDHYVGKVIDAIDELGLKDNTLVFLTADHGESLGDRGYQGHSRELFETILRIPMIIRLPGKIPAGHVVEQRVTTLDFAPTILGLTIGNKTDGKVPLTFTGRDLAPTLAKGGSVPERPVRFVTWPGQKWLMPKWISWMWIGNLDVPLRYGRTEGDRKVVWTPGDQTMEVFNLTEDPDELHGQGLKASNQIYKKETSALKRWYKSTYKDQSETQMDERDREILKSLGYL